MNKPRFAKKYAAKFAKLKEALEELANTAVEAYEEVVGQEKEAVVPPTTVEPKPKPQSRKNSPRKKKPDLKKKPTKKRTTKRKSPKKD